MLNISAPAPIERGDRFGDLKALDKAPSKSGGHGMRYWAGCAMGHKDRYTAAALRRGKCRHCKEHANA